MLVLTLRCLITEWYKSLPHSTSYFHLEGQRFVKPWEATSLHLFLGPASVLKYGFGPDLWIGLWSGIWLVAWLLCHNMYEEEPTVGAISMAL